MNTDYYILLVNYNIYEHNIYLYASYCSKSSFILILSTYNSVINKKYISYSIIIWSLLHAIKIIGLP